MADDWGVANEVDEWGVADATPITHRSVGERAGENFVDSAMRNPTIASARQSYSDPMAAVMPVRPGYAVANILPWNMQAALGATSKLARVLGIESPAALDATKEKARRQSYEARAAEDPWYTAPGGVVGKAAAGAGTLAGVLGGALTDPTSFADGGGKTLVSRILGMAGLNALGDAATQSADIASGVQERYSPAQTAAAAALAAPIEGGRTALGAALRSVKVRADAAKAKAAERAAAMGDDLSQGRVTPNSLWSRLIQQESGGNQGAVSPKGARGVAQLMEETAADVAEKLGNPGLAKIAMEDSERGRVANEILGKTYLSQMLQRYGNDPALALAAYNAGPGRVDGWLAKFGHPDQVGRARWLAMLPFKETRDYVHKILGDVAGEPHKLTPEDETYMRGRMAEFPDQEEVPVPPLERAAQALDEGDRIRAEAADDFPGDRPSTGEGITSESIPWDDETPPENSLPPSPKENSGDLTDQALDQMRSGKPVVMGEGPSLSEALARAGGVRDEGGELTNLLGGQGDNRLFKMLRRVKTGMSLDDAALWAQERGYIGKPDMSERATPQELLSALEREIRGGERVYPPDRINEQARTLREHMDDLDEVLQHIGMDPKTHTNAEIREAMDAWYHEAEGVQPEPGWAGMMDTGEVLGLNPKAAMATGAEAVSRAREAAQRMAWRQQIEARVGGGRALPGARQRRAIPAGAGPAGPVKSVVDIIRTLEERLAIPVRQGRIAMRNALGIYNRRSGMVRSQSRYDIDTLAHEFGHAIEFSNGYRTPNVKATIRQFARTLTKWDYNQRGVNPLAKKKPQGRSWEGFAEWMRLYITNPQAAAKLPGEAPWRKAFLEAMAKDDPDALDAIHEAQRDYEAHHNAPSVEVTRAAVVEPAAARPLDRAMEMLKNGNANTLLSDFSNGVYRGVVDFLHPWRQAVEASLDRIEEVYGERPRLAAVADAHKILRRMANIAAVGKADLEFGVFGYHGLEPESPSFVEAVNKALGEKWTPEGIKDFGTYLIGRRAIDLYDSIGKPGGLELPPDRLSKEDWEQSVMELEQLHPEFAEAAEAIYAYNNALWKKRFDGGLITEKEYADGLEQHPSYVPMFRDVSDKAFPASGKRGAGTKAAGGVVQLKGSDRAYINPLYSIMNMTYELNAQLARNDALKAMDDLAQLIGPDMGRIVERIPPKDIKGIKTSVDEVVGNAASRFGVSRRDAASITDSIREMFGIEGDDELGATIYRAKATGERGEPIVYMYRDGKRIPLQLPDGAWGQHMVESLAGMTPPMRSFVLDLVSIPSVLLRFGVTAHPAFFLSNTVRDQMMASVLTDVGYRPFWDQARGIASEGRSFVTPDDITKQYMALGGEIGGWMTAGAHMANREQTLRELQSKGRKFRHFATLEGLARAAEVAETGTRKGIFERGKETFEGQGYSPYAAAVEAASEAQDFMPFSRHGAYGATRVFARIVPFLNAGIQGLDKELRVVGGVGKIPDMLKALFGGPPSTPLEAKQAALAVKYLITAAVLAAGGLALRAAYDGDPEYDAFSNDTRFTHWAFKLPDGEMAIVPKPYGFVGFLSNVFERAYERVHKNDPTAWKNLADALFQGFAPAHDVAALKPFLEVMQNRDGLGGPIVPESQKNLLPRDQFTDRTSGLAKYIGQHWPTEEGLSPAKIDHILKGYTGSWGRDILDATNGRAPIAENAADTFVLKRFVKQWSRGNNDTEKFYDLTGAGDGRWAQAADSVRTLVLDGKNQEAMSRLKEMKGPERAFVMATVFAEGNRHRDEKDAGKFMGQDHPMIRAREASAALGGLARDLMDGNVRGADLKPVSLTPRERRDAIEALRKWSAAEHRNAMIISGVEGWANREPLPMEKYQLEFLRAAPQLRDALGARFAEVQPLGTTIANWMAHRADQERVRDDASLNATMEAKRFPMKRSGEPTAAAMQRALSDVVEAPR